MLAQEPKETNQDKDGSHKDMHSMKTRKHVEGASIDGIGKIEGRLIIFDTLANNKDKTQSKGKKEGIHSFLIGTESKGAMGSRDRKSGSDKKEGIKKGIEIGEDGLNTRRRPDPIEHDGRA